MKIPKDAFAMVPENSVTQKGLLALGWAVTDAGQGWAHMEPPEEPVELVENAGVLSVGPRDTLIVTGEDLQEAEVKMLREEIEKAKADPDYTIVTNFLIHTQVIRWTTREIEGSEK